MIEDEVDQCEMCYEEDAEDICCDCGIDICGHCTHIDNHRALCKNCSEGIIHDEEEEEEGV